MTLRHLLYGATLVLVTATVTTQVVSQDKKDKPAQSPPAGMSPEQAKMMQEMEAKWNAFRTPNENHKLLDFKAGKWNGVVKMWMDPHQPAADESTCITEYKWIMDGRYLADTTEGSFNNEKFMGHSVTGYDNIKKKFGWVWIDNFGTGFMVAEGSYDPATKTFKYTFESPDPLQGKYVKGWSTERRIDDDHFVSEMHGPGPDGKDFKMMEISYTRAK